MAKKKKQDLPKAGGDKGNEADGDRGRVVAMLAVCAALGVSCGALAVGRLPVRDLLPGARAAGAFAKGDAAALAAAAAADRDGPAELARGALADALLVNDFAAAAELRERIAALAKADVGARKLPEALYARALATRIGVDDPSLDGDLAAAGGDDGKKDDDGKKGDDAPEGAAAPEVHPAILLARAARRLDRHIPDQQGLDRKGLDDAWQETRQAALRPDAPIYAMTAAARVALARGEPAEARVFLERGLERAPKNGMLLALLVVAGTFDRPEDEQAAKAPDEEPEPKPKKDGGKQQDPDEDSAQKQPKKKALPVTTAEVRASRALGELSPRDAAVVAFTLEALALARGDATQAANHAKRVLAEAPASGTLAAYQAGLSLLTGDVAAAEELVTKGLKGAAADPDLLLARARVRAMKLAPAEARKADGRATATRGDVLALPLGRLALDATAPGLPWRIELDQSVSPDRWLRAERAARMDDLEGRLSVVENVWAAEHALGLGDVATAAEAAGAARAKAPKNVDALLVDARVRLLKGDREGMRAALQAALAAGSDDARVPLAATRIAYDAEDLAQTRSYLNELGRLGYKSPAALALTAVLTAREGDAKGAQAAIKEAETLSPDDVDVLRGRLMIARLGGNLVEVRKQADRLLEVDDARSPDPLARAWEGEALFRKGQGERAQSVLASVLAARPGLVDAHLAMGIALAGPRPLDAAASFAQAIQIGGAGDTAIVAEATKRRAAIADAPPLQKNK
ncbi:MAG: hypothetical protein HYS27_25875 [Deltaproteobacteria bacterium]|nr:hypothetical protein [Deltaproteobacteria bacterium]